MPERGEIVMLKSGGPMMTITYVFKNADGAREKAANMKGFNIGDCVCEWEHIINEDSKRKMKSSFKSAMLMYSDGTPLPASEGGDDDDDW